MRYKVVLLRMAYSAARLFHRAGLARMRPFKRLASTAKRAFIREEEGLSAPFLVIELDGMELFVPYNLVNNYVVKDFEPQTRRIMADCIRPGMIVLDVGANIGYHTVFAARIAGPEGLVYAVEPASDNIEFLRKNIEANSLRNVEVLPYAAGKADRERQFYFRKCSSLHSLYRGPQEEVESVKVREMPLDEVVTGRVNFVKLDIEGGEIEALEGMRNILKDNDDIKLIVEWNPAALRKAGRSPVELPACLAESGFDLSVIDEMGKSPVDVHGAERLLNENRLDDRWYINLFAERKL